MAWRRNRYKKASGVGIKRETTISVSPFVLGQVTATGKASDQNRKNFSGEYAYCDISFEKLREICMHPQYKSGGDYPCYGKKEIREFLETMDYDLPIAKNTIERLNKEAKAWRDKLNAQPGVAKKVGWSITGAHLSMSRVYSGRTTFFKSRRKVRVPNKQVCLLITTALHGWASKEEYYKIGLLAYQRAVLASRQNMAVTILLCDPCSSAAYDRNNYFFLTTPVIKSKKVHSPSNFILAALPLGLAGYWGFSGECLNDHPGSGEIGLSQSIRGMLKAFPKIKEKIENRYGEIEIIDSQSHLAHTVNQALVEDYKITSNKTRGIIST